jgi:hypothetical protein
MRMPRPDRCLHLRCGGILSLEDYTEADRQLADARDVFRAFVVVAVVASVLAVLAFV